MVLASRKASAEQYSALIASKHRSWNNKMLTLLPLRGQFCLETEIAKLCYLETGQKYPYISGEKYRTRCSFGAPFSLQDVSSIQGFMCAPNECFQL